MKAMKLTAALMIAGSGAVFSASVASAMQQGVSYPALYAGQYQAYNNNYGMPRNGYMTVADKVSPNKGVANKGTTVPKNQPQQPSNRSGSGQNGYGFGNGTGNANGAGSGKGSGNASGGFNMGFNGNVKGNAAGNAAGNNNWAGNGQGWGQNSGGYNQNPWRAQVQKAPQGNATAPQMKAPSAQPQANRQMPRGSSAMPPQGMRQGQMRRPNMGMQNPNMNMPRANMNMPNMRMPNMNMPNMRMPNMRAPNMNMPNMRMPNMNMPNMRAPNMNMPNMRMPNMNMPNMRMPNMNMPNMRMNTPGFRGYPPQGFQRPNMGQPMGRPMPQQRPTPMPQGSAVQPNMNMAPKQPWYKRWGNTNPAQNGQKQGWWNRFSKPGQQPAAPVQQNAPTAAKQGSSSAVAPQAPQFNNRYQQRPPMPQGQMQVGPNGGQAGMMAPNGGFFRQPPAPWMNQNKNVQVPPAPVAPTAKSDEKIAPKGH